MRATRAELGRYVSGVASRLWTLGAELAVPEIQADPAGNLAFTIEARLPDAGRPQHALVRIRELWQRSGADWQRAGYLYDLVDHPRGRRRAYHLHDADAFRSAHDVVVHEHCEETLGTADCDHYAGEPVPDAYRGAELLLLAWSQDEGLGCADLRCLDGG